jgi:hypothetical protein
VSSFRDHEVGNGSGAASSEKLEGKGMKVMELDALIDAQLYMCNRGQYDNSLPEKKDAFLFQPVVQFRRGIKEPKSLKV